MLEAMPLAIQELKLFQWLKMMSNHDIKFIFSEILGESLTIL